MKNVIFDLDGTLLNSLDDLAISTNYALSECGYPTRTIEEIRTMVREMAEKVTKELPFLKKYLVPKCEMLGYCNEPKRSCGRKKLRSEVIG